MNCLIIRESVTAVSKRAETTLPLSAPVYLIRPQRFAAGGRDANTPTKSYSLLTSGGRVEHEAIDAHHPANVPVNEGDAR